MTPIGSASFAIDDDQVRDVMVAHHARDIRQRVERRGGDELGRRHLTRRQLLTGREGTRQVEVGDDAPHEPRPMRPPR